MQICIYADVNTLFRGQIILEGFSILSCLCFSWRCGKQKSSLPPSSDRVEKRITFPVFVQECGPYWELLRFYNSMGKLFFP